MALFSMAHPEPDFTDQGYRDVTGDWLVLSADKYSRGPFGLVKRWRPIDLALTDASHFPTNYPATDDGVSSVIN